MPVKLTKEDFEAWLRHPVTEQFFLRIEIMAADAQENWNETSWANESLWRDGRASELRIACKARADCAEDILAITFEDEDDDTEHERNIAD
jgi:hypothetical protein